VLWHTRSKPRAARLALIDHGAVPQTGESDRYLSVGEIDLTQWAHAERAMQIIVARYGRIDVLVNIAGGFLLADTCRG